MFKLNQKGFTLVELMVVVAIIGILAAVAIPNFQKYQAKSRQSEAKLALSSLFTAESSFFTEYNSYSGCLSSVGFDPRTTAGSTQYYSSGFLDLSATPALLQNDNVNTGTADCTDGAAVTYYLATNRIGTGGTDCTAAANRATCLAGATLTATAFSARARGNISPSATANDVWSIDNNKQIANVQSGI